jgi:hypothetical protein
MPDISSDGREKFCVVSCGLDVRLRLPKVLGVVVELASMVLKDVYEGSRSAVLHSRKAARELLGKIRQLVAIKAQIFPKNYLKKKGGKKKVRNHLGQKLLDLCSHGIRYMLICY